MKFVHQSATSQKKHEICPLRQYLPRLTGNPAFTSLGGEPSVYLAFETTIPMAKRDKHWTPELSPSGINTGLLNCRFPLAPTLLINPAFIPLGTCPALLANAGLLPLVHRLLSIAMLAYRTKKELSWRTLCLQDKKGAIYRQAWRNNPL